MVDFVAGSGSSLNLTDGGYAHRFVLDNTIVALSSQTLVDGNSAAGTTGICAMYIGNLKDVAWDVQSTSGTASGVVVTLQVSIDNSVWWSLPVFTTGSGTTAGTVNQRYARLKVTTAEADGSVLNTLTVNFQATG